MDTLIIHDVLGIVLSTGDGNRFGVTKLEKDGREGV